MDTTSTKADVFDQIIDKFRSEKIKENSKKDKKWLKWNMIGINMQTIKWQIFIILRRSKISKNERKI